MKLLTIKQIGIVHLNHYKKLIKLKFIRIRRRFININKKIKRLCQLKEWNVSIILTPSYWVNK